MLDHFVQKCMIVDFEISLDPIVHFRTLQSFRTVRFRDIVNIKISIENITVTWLHNARYHT